MRFSILTNTANVWASHGISQNSVASPSTCKTTWFHIMVSLRRKIEHFKAVQSEQLWYYSVRHWTLTISNYAKIFICNDSITDFLKLPIVDFGHKMRISAIYFQILVLSSSTYARLQYDITFDRKPLHYSKKLGLYWNPKVKFVLRGVCT